MIDILLIANPISIKQRYKNLRIFSSINEPLGLCYIGAIIKKHKLKYKIVDCQIFNFNKKVLFDIIDKYNPGIIGFSAVTAAIENVKYYTKAIRQRYKDKLILLGGPHISAVPEETMQLCSEIDIGVIGEGEKTFEELLKSDFDIKNISHINGIIYKNGKDIIKTPSREICKNIDTLLSPDYDEIIGYPDEYKDIYSENLSASIICSRGCQYRCFFCYNYFNRNFSIFHSASYIVEIIKKLYEKYGVTYFNFQDDNLFGNREYILDLTSLIIKEKLDIKWNCQVRVDCIDKEILQAAKSAGCHMICFGLESGSQYILDKIGKKINLHQVNKAIELTNKYKIHTHGLFMIGSPYETRHTLKETQDFLLTSQLCSFQATIFTPFPGTKFYEKYKSKIDWSKANMLNVIIENKNLNKLKIKIAYWKLYLRFYLRWKVLKNNYKYFLRLVKNLFRFKYCERLNEVGYKSYLLYFYTKSFLRKILKSSKKKELVLDIGAGNGILFEPGQINAILLDKDYKILLKNNNSKIKINADAVKIPLKNEIIEKILLIEVIQCIANIEDMIKEVSRILKKNGIIIISMMNKESFIRKIHSFFIKDAYKPYYIYRLEGLLEKLAKEKIHKKKIYYLLYPFPIFLKSKKISLLLKKISTNYIIILQKYE